MTPFACPEISYLGYAAYGCIVSSLWISIHWSGRWFWTTPINRCIPQQKPLPTALSFPKRR